jgi:hypothetical protein
VRNAANVKSDPIGEMASSESRGLSLLQRLKEKDKKAKEEKKKREMEEKEVEVITEGVQEMRMRSPMMGVEAAVPRARGRAQIIAAVKGER